MKNILYNQISGKQIISHKTIKYLELLRVNATELDAIVSEEMIENPFLIKKDDNDPISKGILKQMKSSEINELKDLAKIFEKQYKSKTRNIESNEYFNIIENSRSSDESPYESLIRQSRSLNLNQLEKKIIGFLIENIDENGYLRIDPIQVTEIFNIEMEELERIIGIIQTFEPTGVGAVSLKECLSIQARELEISIEDRQLVETVIQEYLELVAENNVRLMADILHVDMMKVKSVFSIIKGLDPKPLAKLGEISGLIFVYPDMDFKYNEENGNLEVYLNEKSAPSIQINPTYIEMILNPDLYDDKVKKFILEKITKSIEFIEGVENRRDKVLSLCHILIERQEDFFKLGLRFLSPLTRREAAALMGVHESTVSRIVNDKYFQCRHGVYKLSLLFSKGYANSEGSEQTSVTKIKEIIREVVIEEESSKPLSDIDIADNLKKKGISISRRAVAKYRGEIGIPGSYKRKKSEDTK